MDRERITAVSIQMGVVTLIDNDGNIRNYRQRGIGRLSKMIVSKLIKNGCLHNDIEYFEEIPSNYFIEFENEEIMGKARTTFTIPKIYLEVV